MEAGGAKAEAARRFSSVHNWLKRDNLAPTKVKHRERKLNWKALEQHIKDESDAKLKDRAEHFGVHTTAIWYAIKHNESYQKKTAKISRAQSSRETRISPTITADCSTTGKSEFNLHR